MEKKIVKNKSQENHAPASPPLSHCLTIVGTNSYLPPGSKEKGQTGKCFLCPADPSGSCPPSKAWHSKVGLAQSPPKSIETWTEKCVTEVLTLAPVFPLWNNLQKM